MENKILMSLSKMELSVMSFQPTIELRDNDQFLRSVNIILGNKIIKKIYQKEPLLKYEYAIAKLIATNFIIDSIKQEKKQKRKVKTAKSKPKGKHYYSASKDFMSDLGL